MTADVNEASATEAWTQLDRHWRATEGQTLREMFAADAGRFERLSARRGDMLLDYSKCRVTAETMTLLARLAHATGVARQRDAMFAGEKINSSEGRAVLHTALRNRSGEPVLVAGRDVMGDVRAELARVAAFADGVRNGSVTAADGGRFTDVVNIGIGGSDLGPAMASAALTPFCDGPRAHFVSNVDAAHLTGVLNSIDLKRTLLVVASKTFTTIETMTNAQTARAKVAAALGEGAVARHFAAVSTALDKVAAFGIQPSQVFGFWDWVGGRYSMWSAIGLPLMIAIGPERFGDMLDGAHDMDVCFRTAPLPDNLPMLSGLLAVWHRAVCGYATRAIVPYDQRLARLPAYLQQLEMESNGKRVRRDGELVARWCGAVVWGAPGTDAQHSFFQLLHQGQDVVPVELLIGAEPHVAGLESHHRLLTANCLAQSEALALGRTEEEARAQMIAQGRSAADADRLAAQRTFPGNRPSTTLAYKRLDPFTFGRIIALYEHRVFVEAAVHGINAFDQWGVELGKELASKLAGAVDGGAAGGAVSNGSTRGLIGHLAAHRG